MLIENPRCLATFAHRYSYYKAKRAATQQHNNHNANKAPHDAMGLAYNTYLESDHKIYGCKNCRAHLSTHEAIMSRAFRGAHGKAFLFSNVVNCTLAEPDERNMTTGRHIVRDISCRQCNLHVGWRYEKAFETSEKYKEGKFILEYEMMVSVT